MEMQDQPTVPVHEDTEITQKLSPSGSNTAPTSQPARQGLSRRALFGGALGIAGAGALAAGGYAIAEWLQHNHAGTGGNIANSQQIGHLLRRAGFGATAQELQTYSALGFSGAVDRLLNYQQVSDTAMEQRLAALKLDLTKPADQQRWWLLRMAWTQRPLLEKMTLFWHGVLTSSFRKVGGPKSYERMIVQNNFLRTHAFDTFDNILLGITADPAMLFYLDLTKSRKNAPNENYARELMELFTLGLGHYSQQDVSMAASALTGWHVKGASTTSYYLERDHNTLTKQFLGQSGNFDYKDVIRMLTNHPAAPWFISRKLFTFFAYENPSDDDLRPLVDTYTKSNHNMGAVMRTLLLSPQFSSAKAYRSRVKSPTEYVVGTYRMLGIEGDGTSLPTLTTLMGQTLFDPPNVAGWPGDKVSSTWLNSGAWMTRLNYIDLLLAGSRNARVGRYKPLDIQSIVDANHIDTPERFVDYFASYLLDGVLDHERRQQLIDYFTTSDTTGQNGVQITLSGGKRYPLSRVRGTLYLMLAAPEFQLN